MRALSFERNVLRNPAGSCRVAFGNTVVLCSATIEETVPPFLEGTGRGWLSAEYAMLPGSTPGGRKRREIGKRDGRSTEIQRLVGRALRAAVHLDRLGSRSIVIDCDVMEADGGTRTAAISGGWVALCDALAEVARRDAAGVATAGGRGMGALPPGEAQAAGGQSPAGGFWGYLRGQVAAVSVGIVAGEIVCDLDYARDSRADVDMNVVKLDDAIVEVQGTGERAAFDRAQLAAMLDAADEAIREIFAAQRAALAGHAGH